MSMVRRSILLACGASLAHCSLDGLTDGRMAGTGGKGATSTTASSSTGMSKPHMFAWAVDLGATPSNGTVHLAPSPSTGGVVVATSGVQVTFPGTPSVPCGMDACVATIDASGKGTPLADGIGGSASKTINGVAASTDRVVVVGAFNGTLTVGSGTGAMTLGSMGKQEAFIAMFDATTRHVTHVARLRSTDSMGGAEVASIAAVALDANDNVYVTGLYHDSLLLTSAGGAESPPIAGLTPGMLSQGFVMKFNSTLTESWALDFGSSSDSEAGSAIDVSSSGVVAFGGIAHAPVVLGGALSSMKTCAQHYTAITGNMALVGFVDGTGAPVQCDSFGSFSSDISAVVATGAGALFGGRYATQLTWPALPATGGARFGYVFEQSVGSVATPAAQPIVGDLTTSFHELNAMALVNGSLYIGATTNGSPSFNANDSCPFPIIGNNDGFVGVEPKMPGAPFSQPKGLVIGSPSDETVDTLAVTSAGGIIVGGTYKAAFDVLPATAMGGTDRYVAMVNPVRLVSPCPP